MKRGQYVFYNGVSSDIKNITCGVSQGSVLGPLLFLLCIDYLPYISQIMTFYFLQIILTIAMNLMT